MGVVFSPYYAFILPVFAGIFWKVIDTGKTVEGVQYHWKTLGTVANRSREKTIGKKKFCHSWNLFQTFWGETLQVAKLDHHRLQHSQLTQVYFLKNSEAELRCNIPTLKQIIS